MSTLEVLIAAKSFAKKGISVTVSNPQNDARKNPRCFCPKLKFKIGQINREERSLRRRYNEEGSRTEDKE